MKLEIGIIGGSGLYELLKNPSEENIETKYGKTSKILTGNLGKKVITFIPRHGEKHTIPPHSINHRANISAMKKMGVKKIIGTAAVGIINKDIKPGDFVIPHDFIDFTGKPHTFFDKFEGKVVHADMTRPFSEKIRESLKRTCEELKYPFHDNGVYVNTTGPRFETPAEIKMFNKLGGDIIGMTNAPEVILSNEIGVEYGTIAIGTNYACGISKKTLTFKEVQSIMKEKEIQLKKIIKKTVESF